MNFYEMWDFARSKQMDESSFLIDFLRQTSFSVEILENGTNDEVLLAISMLLSTDVDLFVNKIEDNFNPISADSIVQFSTFEHALFSINRLIHFSNGKMTFSDLGKEIVNAKQDGANKKYGENHSKVAAMLSLVTLQRDGVFFVKNTTLGELSISMSKEDKIQLSRRLAIRNPFIQKIISEAKEGNCDYMILSRQYLSESTALRRKSNVKFIVTLILEGTSFEYLLKNIVW